MRVLFWNIRGVKKEAGKRFLQSLISEYYPDILCLAEPMVQVSKFPVLFFNKLGYSAEFIHNIRHERCSNLWIIWKRGLSHPSIASMSAQQLSIEVDWQGKKLLLSFIHASCFKIERRDLWSELAAVSAASLPLLIVGDFNATLFSNEKKGLGNFNVGSAAEFQAMVDSCMLISTSSQGKKYTWSNNRRRGNVMAVLDRSFHNELWIDEFKNISQRVITCTASDHTPILIHSNMIQKPSNIPFRFHNFWMEDDNFQLVVKQAWSQQVSGCPIYILAQKLKVVKGVLKAWAKERFPNLNEEVKKATSELKRVQDTIEVSGMSDALFNEEADAKTALLNASKMQEKLWSEKAKLRWLKEGDRNTKFFHLSVKIRRSRNQISMLRREDGSWISDQLDLANYIVDFYKNFHSENPVEPHYELLDQIPTLISNEDNAFLDAVPSREEIKMAIWDLDADSSPGPDGFPGQFFRSCWDIVENDFCRAIFSFFLVGKIPKGVNNCFLTLIPKADGASSLDSFRPICMGNFFCKVLSKIAASRLSLFLPRLISEEQGAFQRGKIISENISLASELANLMHSSVRGGGMGLKLDVQKAYDSLSWEFLFATLKKFGFSPNWINKIHQMLLSTRISILLNGGPVGFFGVERGLRQGDPISPILFILAEEVLCRGLKNLILERKMKALPGPRGAITPSHLLFADDIFIFMNGSARYVKHLHEFLSKYQSFSGQKINLEKSKIFFGKIAPHRSHFISDFLGIAAADLPTKYLRVEIFKGRVKNSHLLSLLDKIKGRLAGFFRERFIKEDGSLRRGYKSSSIWPGLKRVWSFVAKNEQWILGNGKKIDFWLDRWIDNQSIAEKTNLDPVFFSDLKEKVSDFICQAAWDLPHVESVLLAEIWEKAKRIHIQGVNDLCLWRLTSSGIFSIKSAWEENREKYQKVSWFSLIWNSSNQPRQAVFAWRLVQNRLPTDENVSHRGVQMASRCSLCGKDEESMSHLFYNCEFARSLWRAFCEGFDVQWKPYMDMLSFIAWWKQTAKNLHFKKVWITGFSLVPSVIWQERNARIFEGVSKSSRHCFAMIKSEISLQMTAATGSPLSFSSLLCAKRLGISRVRYKPREVMEIFWCPPQRGWVKLNSDGCSLGNPGKAGAGGVFRNENSEILQSFRTFLGVHTNFEAEMIAVITGLEFARDMGITHLWIECDSVAVVLLIAKGRIPWFCLQRWMSLTSYLNSLTWKITHCMREANPVADFLAKTAAKFEVSSPIQSWPVRIAIELEVDGQSRPRYRFF
ncbi:uncharacterized protein LOC122061743 [Macadamia integrifolia]|uniref:uncharacterized protein LOC122061743 n=1 Tax=Macadamia integrifolia TaxID=60698 RepID=UPI001C4FB0A5|nr:uncharacterized protein LOC122061743 [Macadamia integrifolia]